jgi:MFS family permease
VLAVVATGQFVVSLDISVVNVALPAIREGLGFSASGLAWVVNAYVLAFGGLLLLGGRLGDLLGRRRVLTACFALFGAASLAGGLAQEPWQLVAARAAQGVAAAGLAPAALALLSTTFPEGAARARALAIWAAVTAAGGAVGVLASGLLTELASWRWVMLVNVPVVVAVVPLALRALPRDHTARPGGLRTSGAGGHAGARGAANGGSFDLAGALLATGGCTALVLGVLRTDVHGWGSAATLGTLAAAAAMLALFALVEARVAREPLLRLGLLARRQVAVANLVTALICAGQFAAFYFVSLLLQETLGYRPIETGLAFLPFCAGIVAGSVAAMRLLPAHGPRPLLLTGGLLAAAGMLWFDAAAPGTSYLGGLLGPMLVASTGLGLCFLPATAAATAGVAPAEAGMAAGLVNASRQLGGAIGLAALVAIGQPPALAVAAGLMAAAALASQLLRPAGGT